ncbi:hypothetical protein BJ912DRAFT_970031 [Pholiota molesta]|nr:hypothetical protein BJ912DRAFT_970031 [Pholiota molesta]
MRYPDREGVAGAARIVAAGVERAIDADTSRAAATDCRSPSSSSPSSSPYPSWLSSLSVLLSSSSRIVSPIVAISSALPSSSPSAWCARHPSTPAASSSLGKLDDATASVSLGPIVRPTPSLKLFLSCTVRAAVSLPSTPAASDEPEYRARCWRPNPRPRQNASADGDSGAPALVLSLLAANENRRGCVEECACAAGDTEALFPSGRDAAWARVVSLRTIPPPPALAPATSSTPPPIGTIPRNSDSLFFALPSFALPRRDSPRANPPRVPRRSMKLAPSSALSLPRSSRIDAAFFATFPRPPAPEPPATGARGASQPKNLRAAEDTGSEPRLWMYVLGSSTRICVSRGVVGVTVLSCQFWLLLLLLLLLSLLPMLLLRE